MILPCFSSIKLQQNNYLQKKKEEKDDAKYQPLKY